MTFPKGPTVPGFVVTYRWLTKPFELLEDCRDRYGDVFTFTLPQLPPLVVYSNPDVVKTVFADDGDALQAGRFNRSLSAFLGDKSVLMVDGRQHIRKRKLLLPPFHGERMVAYGDVMMKLADEAIDGFPLHEPMSLHSRMNGIALAVIVQNVFGIEPGPKQREWREVFTELLEIMTWPPLLVPAFRVDLGPRSPWGKAKRMLARADALMYEQIRARRAALDTSSNDVLSLLLQARDDDGQPMTDEELRDELLTLLVAGHETTATALSWAMRWILDAPAIESKLREELQGAGGADASPAKVQSLPYLDATVREALRLCPVIPIVGRILTEDMRLGGYDLPKGTGVLCSIYLAHRRPEAYDEPAKFKPERFLDKKPTPSEFFPFGGGIRRCIGMAFAIFEMKMVLARLLARTRMSLAPKKAIRPVRRSITLMPSDGLRLRVEERRAVA